MSTFSKGDVVIIVGLIEGDVLFNDKVAVITSEIYMHPECKRWVHNVMIERSNERWSLEPGNMRHKPYDGNKISTWEKSIWVPEVIRQKWANEMAKKRGEFSI